MSFDNLSLGFTGTNRFSGNRGRTADGTNRSGIRYPSPFFDIGHTYLPPSMKGLMRWCRYYYLVNPLINSTIHKMSEYPVTEIVIDEKNESLRKQWEQILHHQLRIRAFQIEVGLDYYTYGMCVVTMHFPFDKYLICRNCDHKHLATKTAYRWRNLDYIVECDKCGHYGPAKVQDYYVKNVSKIKLMRWNPEYINVDPAFAGADPKYTFELPLQTKNDIILGKKSVLDTIPDVFIESIKRNKFISFAPENIFVFKRPIISQKDDGWGMPLIFPVLKDTFYMQVLRKAQEMIAQEHIVPLRVLFPQAGSNSSDPYTTIDLNTWKGRIEAEIAKWKYDQNYIPILPLPIGHQTIGGDGKALGLYQEMEIWAQHIVAGMGVPQEFIFGGMQYSGSNVSMRMLENTFIGYRTDHENMLNNFVIRRIANYMGWKPIQAHMRRFKMADDLQRTAFFFQLAQAQMISQRTLLAEADFDFDTERERKEQELDGQLAYQRKSQAGMADIQGEVQKITAKAQADAAALVQPTMPGTPPGAEGAQDGLGAAMGQPGAEGGAEGGSMDGQQAIHGMPQGSTVDQENLMAPPGQEDGADPMAAMQSPLGANTIGGGYNLMYLAKRAVTRLSEMPQPQKMAELQRMKLEMPQLYSVVLPRVMSQKGSQEDPLNPLQSPLPQQKPERRASPVGM